MNLPSSCKGVGGTDNSGVEHNRAPELTTDKGGEGESDKHTNSNEATDVADSGHAEGGGGGK